MRFSVVLNQGAGRALGQTPEGLAALVQAWFEAAGLAASVVAVASDALASALDQAVDAGTEVVVVGGGDGSVALAADRLRTRTCVLGVIPLGTMNLLARDLNIPLDPEAAVRALAAAEVRAIDVAEVNGRLFLHSSVLGVYAWLAQVRERYRGRSVLVKGAALARAMVKAIRSYKVMHVGLATECGHRSFRVPMLCVANNALRQSPLSLGQRHRLDGGRLAVYAPRHQTPIGFIGFVLRLLCGTWGTDSRLETLHTRRVAVVSRRRRLCLANDGEVLSVTTPLRYRSLPGALRVLAPRPTDREAPEVATRQSGSGMPLSQPLRLE